MLKQIRNIALFVGFGALLGFGLGACNPSPTPAPAPASTVQGPTTQLEALGNVKMAPAASVDTATPASTAATPTAKSKRHGLSASERAAYGVAYFNAAKANSALGAHVYKTNAHDQVGTGTFKLSKFVDRDCVSDPAG
jgi:hypothetical protein